MYYFLARVYKYIGSLDDYCKALAEALKNPYTLTFPQDAVKKEYASALEKSGAGAELEPESEIDEYDEVPEETFTDDDSKDIPEETLEDEETPEEFLEEDTEDELEAEEEEISDEELEEDSEDYESEELDEDTGE